MRDNSDRTTARLQATVLFCAGFCLLSHSRAFGEELKPEAVYQKAIPSVATLVVEKNDGSEAIGSAFMAVKDGLAVTAWHVVKDAKSVLARFAGGEEFEVSGLVDKDEKRDVALVKVKVFGRPMLTLRPSAPEVGSKAYVIGAPKGLEFSISEGLISQVQTIGGVKYDQFSCPASPGNSGGPLVSATGEVTGVVSWQIRDGQNLNFAIPVSYVLGLDSTLPTQPWSTVKIDTPMSVAAVADTATADAVLAAGLLCAADASVAVAGTLEVLKKPAYTSKTDFWTGGVKYKWRLATPVYLYQSQKDVNANIEALQRQSMEGARATLRDQLIADLRSFAEGEQLLIDTVRTIQDHSGWVPAAQDTFGRAAAALPRGSSVDKTALAEVEKSASFSSHLPKDVQLVMGLAHHDDWFQLQVYSFSRNPLFFVVVAENGLAHKLGFQSGDTLVSLAGQTPDSGLGLRSLIKANLGREVRAVVQRDGKEISLKVNIPRTLETN